MRSERRAKILILLTDCFCCDTWWFMTRMVSVCDEADISRHHKSGGWVRRGEVSHTGSSKINFLWPLKTLQGNKDPKAEQQERKDNLPSLWRSPASESSRCCYFCHHWADVIICRAVTCRAHAVRCTNVEPAILSQSRRHLCHGGVTTRLL